MIRLGAFLIFIGIVSFFLPMLGYQFRLISLFGSNNEFLTGIIAIVLGVVCLAISVGWRIYTGKQSQGSGSNRHISQ